MSHQMRKSLSAEGMYSLIHQKSLQIPDIRRPGSQTIPMADTVMSAIAMFALKDPSMLQFCEATSNSTTRNNIQKLFQVNTVPSDTSMRRILDLVPPREFQNMFKHLFSLAQRGKVLEPYSYFEGKYLLSIDGTGFFNSSTIHCENCCEKHHRNGDTTYYHQMLSGAIVHPAKKEVIPIAPEPICKLDGANKNDCERNASERFLRDFRREHPHLCVIVIEDGLASNAPHIRLLEELTLSYILGCKKGDHKSLFAFIEGSEKLGEVSHTAIHEKGVTHTFRFMNDVSLNDSNPDCMVNFIEYWETKANGKVQHFSWVTDIEINKDNIMTIMRGARARWKIENETFNTLKNLGYNFEHNFGHGVGNLSNNLAILMMLVFLVDQLQQLGCLLFQKAIEKAKRLSYLWSDMRAYFKIVVFRSWGEFIKALAFGLRGVRALDILLNTS